MTPEQKRAIEAQIRGWFADDMATETYFGYFGPCDPKGAAKDLAARIIDELEAMV